MINIKRTIYKTLIERIHNLRFLGENNPTIFKHILWLIILDDMSDWANYLDQPQSVQKKLLNLKTNFVLNHCEFNIEKISQLSYTNVNLPQNNNTWKRVWDAPNHDYIEINNVDVIEKDPVNWIPDPNCDTDIVVVDELPGGATRAERARNLTTCEKMNIYIKDNEAWYLTPEHNWERVKLAADLDATEEQIIEIVRENRGKINIEELETQLQFNVSDIADNKLTVIDSFNEEDIDE